VSGFLEDKNDLMYEMPKNHRPEDLAQEILEHLHGRLVETLENYP
jgi:hypothetical protein